MRGLIVLLLAAVLAGAFIGAGSNERAGSCGRAVVKGPPSWLSSPATPCPLIAPIALSTPGSSIAPCPPKDTLTILFTGDVMLGRDVGRLIRYAGPDRLFSPSVDSLFATADAVVANLECPATSVDAPLNKRFVFRADPAVLPALRRHGITHLNMANNHSIDQGREGLSDAYYNITEAGMTAIGYGRNDAEACRPVMIGGGPRPVWVLASLRVMSENYVYMPDRPSVCEASVDRLCDSVRAIRRRQPAACVIVCLHWGVEHTLKPTVGQRHEARRLIDAGADAVVGHHSHTAQSVETYRHRPVFYSLGNFIFDLGRPLNSRGLVARLRVTADTLLADTVPVVIRKCVPEVAF